MVSRVIYTISPVTDAAPKPCVPRVISRNWFFNRRPRGRY